MERLSICNNIVNIADSMKTVEVKAAETLEITARNCGSVML
jgi:hypothetical protein